MPPPETPPVRRFLPGTKSKPAVPRQSYPPPPSSSRQARSSSQFAQTPRFSIPTASRNSDEVQLPSTSTLVARTRRPPRLKQANDDDIEDAPINELPQEASDDEMLLDTVELDLDFDLPPPKRPRRTEAGKEARIEAPPEQASRSKFQLNRKRADDPIVITSSPDPDFRSSPSPSPPLAPDDQVQRPRTPQRSQVPTFTTPAPAALSSSVSQAPRSVPNFRAAPNLSATPGPATSRPSFILPRSTETASSNILPPIFSPHRRGQRFQPGGMASTLRDWVVELTSGGGEARGTAERIGLRGLRDKLKIRVHSVEEGLEVGYWVVRDRQGDLWLLLGDGGPETQAGEGTLPRRGDAVEVRMPIWEAEAKGEKSRVSVNWRVVDPG